MEARLKSCFILPAVLLALLAAGCQERELPVAPEAPAFSTGEDPPIEPMDRTGFVGDLVT